MSYLVLARKLRPCRFDDLVGQETNSKILRNAVLNDRVAHAFLFTGSRGVGKTSAARILTRAINCLNPEQGNPCNSCKTCIDILEDASPDIFEIDAASNRGIDNIRELRESANYVPARCRYKVYIIDEAHMLTIESFNALLKILEEPPKYVKFIFATTDPHKIPQTIISRCQRYDFLRIPVKKIADYLEKIIENEKTNISRKSLEMIAQNSVGGMRDSLTALDQILSIEGESVSDKKIAQILGILDHESRFAFAETLLRKKDKESIIYFHKLQEYGYDVNDILKELLGTIKTTALIKTLGSKEFLFQDISSDDLEAYESLANIVKNDELQQMFQIFLQLEERLKVSSFSKICFEMAILQVTSTESLMGLGEIVSEIQKIRELEFPKKKTKNDSELIYDESKTNYFSKNIEKSYSIKSENKKNNLDTSPTKNILNLINKESSLENVQEEEDSKNHKKESENDINLQNKNDFFKSIKSKESYKKIDTFSKEEYIKDNVGNINNKKDLQLQTNFNNSSDSDNKKTIDQEKIVEVSKSPSSEWLEFSQKAQKESPKLASFVRNAIPQNLAGSNITLIFKSENYASLLDDKSKILLEKIARDLSGHVIQIGCKVQKTFSSIQTIAEYEKMLIENEKELKRKNAADYYQVKEILSVFKNSKISEIKLANE